jgi:glycosyltransferase involved in cell wall biosynthesis
MARRILFVHQNFPGQFIHVARALAAQGHEVVGLGIHSRPVAGVRVLRYAAKAPERASAVVPLRDVETQVVRGLACAGAMKRLRDEGFAPDVVVAHPGWGEALFCKDVWPEARLLLQAEFFYGTEGTDFGFDPEFSHADLAARMRLRLRNSILLQALHAADGGYAPTHWQHRHIPAPFRDRFEVAFEGVDTHAVRPDPQAWVHLKKADLHLAAGDEVLTFVNRNLEPYRGFHVFMRALPHVLRARPQAQVLVIGGDDVSYGSRPAGGGSWRQKLLAELGDDWPRERVHFLGKVPYRDYLRVLQVSRCHVYLTYPFVLSWSCVEAMSAGCTIVASRTAPVQEFIDDGVEGHLVDFFDVDGWVRRLVDVLGAPTDHAELGRRARARVVASHDLETICLPRLSALVVPA